MKLKLNGLVAATHTPLDSDGELNLAVIEKQSEHLLRNGVNTVFIGGTTGECHSLTVIERLALAQRWCEVTRGTPQRVVVHVGSNCLADSRALAVQAQFLGAAAIATLAPCYYKPKSVAVLITCCRRIAASAPALPFYYYDIPSFTGVNLSMPEFLAAAPERLPTLAGIKFTNPDLVAYQKCLHADKKYDIPWGLDECLLAALSVGATGAVGSTYNFAAPIYQRLVAAFNKANLAAARREQFRSVQLIDLLASFGFMSATKTLMSILGVKVGPARLPHTNLTAAQQKQLREELDKLEFFQWIK